MLSFINLKVAFFDVYCISVSLITRQLSPASHFPRYLNQSSSPYSIELRIVQWVIFLSLDATREEFHILLQSWHTAGCVCHGETAPGHKQIQQHSKEQVSWTTSCFKRPAQSLSSEWSLNYKKLSVFSNTMKNYVCTVWKSAHRIAIETCFIQKKRIGQNKIQKTLSLNIFEM